MKVYLGITICNNGVDYFNYTEKVFDDEAKALVWAEEFKPTEWEWREYKEFEVE